MSERKPVGEVCARVSVGSVRGGSGIAYVSLRIEDVASGDCIFEADCCEEQAPEDITLPAVSWRHLGDDQPPVWRVGKKRAGRLLDGRTHDGYPGGEPS